jgi:hypothetical protein
MSDTTPPSFVHIVTGTGDRMPIIHKFLSADGPSGAPLVIAFSELGYVGGTNSVVVTLPYDGYATAADRATRITSVLEAVSTLHYTRLLIDAIDHADASEIAGLIADARVPVLVTARLAPHGRHLGDILHTWGLNVLETHLH